MNVIRVYFENYSYIVSITSVVPLDLLHVTSPKYEEETAVID